MRPQEKVDRVAGAIDGRIQIFHSLATSMHVSSILQLVPTERLVDEDAALLRHCLDVTQAQWVSHVSAHPNEHGLQRVAHTLDHPEQYLDIDFVSSPVWIQRISMGSLR